MKALILAAGFGTRLRPLTSLRPKPLVAVANRSLIRYAIDDLVKTGITEIGIVVSRFTKVYIEDALSSYAGANFEYIVQDPPEGIAHAVKVARPFLGDDPFVLYLADNLFQNGIKNFVETFKAGQGKPEASDAVLALIQVEDPRALGVAVVEDGKITELVEKPEVPPSNLAVAGVYVFNHKIHDVISDLPRGAKNEYQITDAIQKLIKEGGTVSPVEVTGWWKDTGKPDDLLDANRLLLMDVTAQNEGHVTDSVITGNVRIAKGAVVHNSQIVGPVIIAENAKIENAYLGPYTSIGIDAEVRNAEIEYSIVEQRSQLIDVKTRLSASLIGVDVQVSSRNGRPKVHQLILGDRCTAFLDD